MRNDSARKLLWSSLSSIAYFDVPKWVEDSLSSEFPQFSIVIAREESAVYKHIPDAEVFVSHKLDGEQFLRFGKLRWIHSPTAGVTELLVPAVVASDVVVTNARTVHSIPVAEHAIALLLALARNLGECFRYQAEEVWGHTRLWQSGRLPTEVNGKTLGLIGLGSIGGEIAARAKALGMRVVAVKRDASHDRKLAGLVSLHYKLSEILGQADYLVLAAPETSETRCLIGEQELRQMKPGACLINIARGSLVETGALIRALESGTLAGAALDVTEPEPLPSGHPLWQAPNVLITHHMAGATERFWQRQCDLLKENLRRYISGEPLLNVVDKSKGY